MGGQQLGGDGLVAIADQADPRPALAIMGEQQGLQQQGPGRRGKAQEEQVGNLIETRVQTQVRGPAPEEGSGGAVLDGEGLDL